MKVEKKTKKCQVNKYRITLIDCGVFVLKVKSKIDGWEDKRIERWVVQGGRGDFAQESGRGGGWEACMIDG